MQIVATAFEGAKTGAPTGLATMAMYRCVAIRADAFTLPIAHRVAPGEGRIGDLLLLNKRIG